MRIVYMGTPLLAATVLNVLVEKHEIICVYTRPNAVCSRGSKPEPSPVRRVAEHYGIAVRTPKNLRDPSEHRFLRTLAPDIVCVAAYGMILPPEVLAIPRFGCINVHTSLLPRWRGAAPIERAILAGDTETGVCIMRMTEGLDTGPYCVRKITSVAAKYESELSTELTELGAEALLEALDCIECGSAQWIEQSETQACYAPKVEKTELALKPDDSAEVLARKVRASSTRRPARCMIAGKTVAILTAHNADANDEGFAAVVPTAGCVAFVSGHLVLGTADGVLVVESVKPGGKRVMDASVFATGIQGIKRHGAEWGSYDA